MLILEVCLLFLVWLYLPRALHSAHLSLPPLWSIYSSDYAMALSNSLREHGLARTLRDYHLFAVVFWIIMIPISIVTGLWHSVAFVTLISLWALVSTEWGAWQASRAEVASVSVDVDVHADSR